MPAGTHCTLAAAAAAAHAACIQSEPVLLLFTPGLAGRLRKSDITDTQCDKILEFFFSAFLWCVKPTFLEFHVS